MYCQDNNAAFLATQNNMILYLQFHGRVKTFYWQKNKNKIAYQVPVSLIIFVNTEMMDRQQVR